MSPTFSPLGMHLRRLRDERGATQRDLAGGIGRKNDWVSRLERGREYASDDDLVRMVLYFGLDKTGADALTDAWKQSAAWAGASA